ncbi:MAG: DegV family protein [Candidatus Bruticola sp.]
MRIVTDSTCDLNCKLLANLKASAVPLLIHVYGRSYLDGQNITPEILSGLLLKKNDDSPDISTAHPSPQDFINIYKAYPNEEIISIHPSPFLSGSYNAARQAQKCIDPENRRIKVVNSNSISVGLGCSIIETADFINQNPTASINEIVSYVDSLSNRTHLFFTVPSLQYLIRGGRLRAPRQKLSRLMKAYHIFSYSGETSISPVARSFDLERALQEIIQKIQIESEKHHIHRILVAYSRKLRADDNDPKFNIDAAVSALCMELSKLNLRVPVFQTETGCAINIHCGSGAVGVAYLTD